MPDDRSPPNLAVGEYYMGKGVFVDMPRTKKQFFSGLQECLDGTEVRGRDADETFKVDRALKMVEELLADCNKRGGTVHFIGNGGSAAIASHMAIDFSKNKGVRARTLNDVPTLTACGNDFGYDMVFAKQLEWYARKPDVAVIVSSSGRSPNIINAAIEARTRLNAIVTLSGMNPNNALRRRGDVNFYVPSASYALVELAHMALLHSLVLC